MKKGQSAIEGIMSIATILAFVIILYAFVIYPQMDRTSYAQAYYSARSICSDLTNAINTVSYSGNGFNQKVLIPATLSGAQYNLTVYSQMARLSWDKGTVFCQFRAKNISYGSNYPPFALAPADRILNNSNGVVKIA